MVFQPAARVENRRCDPVPLALAFGGKKADRMARSREPTMSFNYFMALCGFMLGLGGCAVAPVAQMATAQVAPASQSCQSGADCGGALHRLTESVAGAFTAR